MPASDEPFNVCDYLLDRHIRAGRGDRLALTGIAGDISYAQLSERARQAAGGLRGLGLQAEQRVVMVMADAPEFVIVYLAAMRIGAVPVPISTMLRADGIAEIVADSRARIVAVSAQYLDVVADALGAPGTGGVMAVVTDEAVVRTVAGRTTVPLSSLPAASDEFYSDHGGLAGLLAVHLGDDRHAQGRDAPAWFGPGGVRNLRRPGARDHAGRPVPVRGQGLLRLRARETACSSRSRSGRPPYSSPARRDQRLWPNEPGSTPRPLFFAGPTFFANMLRADLPADALAGVRLAASAGEALPAALYQRWTSHFGVDILDGIGMTEMLHIFLSNRSGQVKPGTTGVAVPGYELRVLGEDGLEVPPGTPGTLFVRGDSAATGYWSRYDASRQVFQGEWLRTGDTYVMDADGYYACLGRTGDMLKASGIWVAPAEVESRLLDHADVAQAVVVAAADADGLEKPVAFVQLNPGGLADEETLIGFCRTGLPSFKRPRRIVFVTEYPTTATGKIRRVELRAQAAAILQAVKDGRRPATRCRCDRIAAAGGDLREKP